MIRLESVGCRIGGTWALQGASLHVRAGELVGLTGPNGGGKSLLLAICATLVRADAGDKGPDDDITPCLMHVNR